MRGTAERKTYPTLRCARACAGVESVQLTPGPAPRVARVQTTRLQRDGLTGKLWLEWCGNVSECSVGGLKVPPPQFKVKYLTRHKGGTGSGLPTPTPSSLSAHGASNG